MAQESASTFRTDWLFPSEVKTALGADSYEVIDTQLAYSTGRTKYEARFYSGKGRERQLITTRAPAKNTTSAALPNGQCLKSTPGN